MLSRSPILSDIAEIDFMQPHKGPLELRDLEVAIPDDEIDDEWGTMDAISRDEWFPVVIGIMFCAAGKRVTSEFFAELIIRKAISYEALEGFITALEMSPSPIHQEEMALFNDVYSRLRSAQSAVQIAKPENVTNAVVGYTRNMDISREELIYFWLADISRRVSQKILMESDLRDKFNTFTLERILSLPVQN